MILKQRLKSNKINERVLHAVESVGLTYRHLCLQQVTSNTAKDSSDQNAGSSSALLAELTALRLVPGAPLSLSLLPLCRQPPDTGQTQQHQRIIRIHSSRGKGKGCSRTGLKTTQSCCYAVLFLCITNSLLSLQFPVLFHTFEKQKSNLFSGVLCSPLASTKSSYLQKLRHQ